MTALLDRGAKVDARSIGVGEGKQSVVIFFLCMGEETVGMSRK